MFLDFSNKGFSNIFSKILTNRKTKKAINYHVTITFVMALSGCVPVLTKCQPAPITPVDWQAVLLINDSLLRSLIQHKLISHIQPYSGQLLNIATQAAHSNTSN